MCFTAFIEGVVLQEYGIRPIIARMNPSSIKTCRLAAFHITFLLIKRVVFNKAILFFKGVCNVL